MTTIVGEEAVAPDREGKEENLTQGILLNDRPNDLVDFVYFAAPMADTEFKTRCIRK